MNSVLAAINQSDHHDDESEQAFVASLPKILDKQANENTIGSFRVTSDWHIHQKKINSLLETVSQSHKASAEDQDAIVRRALHILSRLVESLDVYSPALKGLHDIHAYVCESLEKLVFVKGAHSKAAAYLYGHSLALSPLTSDAISLAIENLLLSTQDTTSVCLILGVKQGNAAQFELLLPTLLQQIQTLAFQSRPDSLELCQHALQQAMKLYKGNRYHTASTHILQTTHTLLQAAQMLTKDGKACGLSWTCFLISKTPMLLRNSLRELHGVDPIEIFAILAPHLTSTNPTFIPALCSALPVLTTWDTSQFCRNGSVERIVQFFLSCEASHHSFDGLGQLSNVVLNKFAPYLPATSDLALSNLATHTKDAQLLLKCLLAAMGPVTLNTMNRYLQAPPNIILSDVRLLEMSAALLPSLSNQITADLCKIVDDVMDGKGELLEPLLAALAVYPLEATQLAQKAQSLVIWSLDENRSQGAILYALQLAIDPFIAESHAIRTLISKVTQLLLADDPNVVHMALSALSNPALASTLDEKSCRMILLALHQTLEPSIQIVAAKLLTHLATAHRAVVQPLAWNHIRQSLGVMDFLQVIEPSRAVVEACIISNLLPALPPSTRHRYTGPVKDLMLRGLERPQEGPTLSLILQGLANLSRFDTWGSAQQTQLALDLLEMSQEIPRDSQHAALNAISRLLAIPRSDDAYDMLLNVHSTFKNSHNLDMDLKALISGIYGQLGTVERNPVISRDSKAAINRESAVYDHRAILRSQASEHRDKGLGIEWQVSKTLSSAIRTTKGEDRFVVLEVMTALGILRPQKIMSLLAELPTLIAQDVEQDTSRGCMIFLAAALNMSPTWLEQQWGNTARLMGSGMEQDVLSVFKGISIVLDAL